MHKYIDGMSTGFREYEFRAGPLGGKKVREVPDAHLLWAINWNRQYIADRMDPGARVRYRGKWHTAGKLPAPVLQEQIGLAEEAIRACQLELSYRRQTKQGTDHEPPPPAAAQKEQQQTQISFGGGSVANWGNAAGYQLNIEGSLRATEPATAQQAPAPTPTTPQQARELLEYALQLEAGARHVEGVISQIADLLQKLDQSVSGMKAQAAAMRGSAKEAK